MKEKRKIEPPDIPSPKKEKENHEFILKGRMNGRMNRYHLLIFDKLLSSGLEK